VGYGAVGVLAVDVLKLALGFFVPEVMQERDAAVELCLDGGGAGVGEFYFAQAFFSGSGLQGEEAHEEREKDGPRVS
jgi:hypothetical protein